ncbi:MAG: Asp23/Gls24 family envelope stress response protein [Anaerolineae bacterium]
MAEERRLGRIEVSPVAIAGLAAAAVLECYGVVGMAAPTLYSGLAEILHRENYRRGVQVKVVEQRIIIDLYVVLEYGVRISEVAHNIMENVKFRVEKALGVPIGEVNVHVQGLRISSNSDE